MSASGQFQLVECHGQNGQEHITAYHTVGQLAQAVYFASFGTPGTEPHFASVLAYSSRGKAMCVFELAAHGSRLLRTNDGRGAPAGYIRHRTEMPLTRKRRGGPIWSNVRTHAERSLNGAIYFEEGEVGCRALRRNAHLPDSWDGRGRRTERCWKGQNRGAKSWDRTIWVTK